MSAYVIENDKDLEKAKSDLVVLERLEGKVTAEDVRYSIAEYENRTDPARIAAGLSEKAKARLAYLTTYADIHSKSARNENEEKGLEDKGRAIATPLGLAVLAELQAKPSPERWGVFGCGSGVAFCVCDSCNDIHIIADALRGHGYTVEVRKI